MEGDGGHGWTWAAWGHGGTWGRSWEERGKTTTMLTTNIPDPPPKSPRNKTCSEETKPYSKLQLSPRSNSRLLPSIRTQHSQRIFVGASNSDITLATCTKCPYERGSHQGLKGIHREEPDPTHGPPDALKHLLLPPSSQT